MDAIGHIADPAGKLGPARPLLLSWNRATRLCHVQIILVVNTEISISPIVLIHGLESRIQNLFSHGWNIFVYSHGHLYIGRRDGHNCDFDSDDRHFQGLQ